MTATSALHVGIIGLGNIGGNMAANLLKRGFRLSAYDIETTKASATTAMGGIRRDSVQVLASHANVIITSLPGPQQLEAVMFGNSGVLAHARPGTVWLDTGTNSIETMTAISARASELGIESIAAPVSGGVRAAETGTLSIFVGGNAETFAKSKGVLEAVGELNARFAATPLESGERLCELFDQARSFYGGEENFVSIVNVRR